ncbi:MAG: hypothetical protein K0Q59_4248 [Paenibacillus sp.]|nr:hypothetical protein [Paenibacillus sp.]
MTDTNNHAELNKPLAEYEVADSDIFAALDPEWPGLERVIQAYRTNELDEAKQELIRYFHSRQTPQWFFDYRGQPLAPIDPNENRFIWGDSKTPGEAFIQGMIADADRLSRHKFQGAVLHDLGERWDQFPVFDMNQADNKPLRVTANRFTRMNFLNSLAFAYHHTQDLRYGETYVQLLESFLENYLRQYPLVPDPVESPEAYSLQFSRNPFRNNMSLARSALNAINIMYTELFYAPFVPYRLSFRLFRFMWYVMMHHLSFERNRYRYHNHHLFERGFMPLTIGIMFPEFPAFRPLLARGKKVVWEHLDKDFYPSGGYDEHSLSYSCDTTLSEFLAPITVITERNAVEGFGDSWTARLNRTYSFYSGLVLPDGTFPDIGDGGGGAARLILEHGERLYGNTAAGAVLRALGLTATTTAESAAAIPSRDGGDRALPSLTVHDPLAGYMCSRENWTASSNCMVLSNKVFTRHCAHNHVDMLSLILAVRGETLIGEPQAELLYKYVSNQSELDDYVRGLGSHNTVLVQGKPVTKRYLQAHNRLDAQTVYTEELADQPDRLYVRAYHQAYTHAKHIREVLFVRDQGWWIADTVELNRDLDGGNGAAEPHVQRWHLQHGVQVESVGRNALLLTGQKSRLLGVWPEDSGVSVHLWRNEAVLNITELPRYAEASELPWIIDIRFAEGEEAGTLLPCIIVDVSDANEPLPEQVDRCRQLLKGSRLLEQISKGADEVHLKGR